MSNVLGLMLTDLTVKGIRKASDYVVSGVFPQVLRALIGSQAIYDMMEVFGNIGCNPTLNEEVVKEHFPDFATVWNAFYSGTGKTNVDTKKANDIISSMCPNGKGCSTFNPMLNNGQEVAQHLTTIKALKSNKYLFALVTFIIYYHESVTESQSIIHDQSLLIGGRVGYQQTSKTIATTINMKPSDKDYVSKNASKGEGVIDVCRFELGSTPKSLKEFGLIDDTEWLNLKEWMAFLFKPIGLDINKASKEYTKANNEALTKLKNKKIELNLKKKYESVKNDAMPNAKKQDMNKSPQSQSTNTSSITSNTKSARDTVQQHLDNQIDESEEITETNDNLAEQTPCRKGENITSPDKESAGMKASGNHKDGEDNNTTNNNEFPQSPGDTSIDQSGGTIRKSTGEESSNIMELNSAANVSNSKNKRSNNEMGTEDIEEAGIAPPLKKKQTTGDNTNNNETDGTPNKRGRSDEDSSESLQNKKQKVSNSKTTKYQVLYNHKNNDNDIIYNKMVQIYSTGNTVKYSDLTDDQNKQISNNDDTNEIKSKLMEDCDWKEGDQAPIYGVITLTVTNETDISFYNHCLTKRHAGDRGYWTRQADGSYTSSSKMLPQPSIQWERRKDDLQIDHYRKYFAIFLDIMNTQGYRYLSEKSGEGESQKLCLRFLYIKNLTCDAKAIRGGGTGDSDCENEYDPDDSSSSDESIDSMLDKVAIENDKSFAEEAKEYNTTEEKESSEEESEKEEGGDSEEESDDDDDGNEESENSDNEEEDNEYE